MNKVRLFLSSVLFTALALSISLQAGISPLAFNRVFECFKPGYEMYAPNLGCAALQTGIVNNIRFCMVNPGKKDARGNRLWIEDKAPANDPVAALAKLLFPSPTGNLAVETNCSSNIGRYLTVEHVAQLLNFCAQIRTIIPCMGGNRFGKNAHKCIARLIAAANKKLEPHTENYFTKFFESEVYSLNTASMNILRSLLKHTQQGRELLVALCKVIELEEQTESNSQFYPKFQAEQLLNAFFCSKFSKDDIPTLLAHLDDSIVDHEILPEARLIELSDIERIIKKDIEEITLDDFWILQNQTVLDQLTAYPRNGGLVNHCVAHGYDRTHDRLIDIKFSNCADLTLRHLSNFILYSKDTQSFNLFYVKGRLKDSPFLKNLEEFYMLQTPDQANSGDIKTGNAWSKVIGDLGHSVDYNKVHYKNGTTSYNEINVGIINMIRVLNIIFNLNLTPEPIYQGDSCSFINQTAVWAKASIERAFKLLSPHKKVSIEITGLRTIIGSRPDCIGTITITVDQDFKFSISHTSRHVEVSNLTILIAEKKLVPQEFLHRVTEKFAPVFLGNTQESLFLLGAHTKNQQSRPLYALFPNSVKNDWDIIRAINQLLVLTQNQLIPHKCAARILKNCLQIFSWQAGQITNSVQSILQEWKHFADEYQLNDIHDALQEEAKVINYALFINDFKGNADDFLNFFYKAKELYINAYGINSKIEKICLKQNHPSLNKIDISFSDVTELEILGNCPNLKEISAMNTSKLIHMRLSGCLNSLTVINLCQSDLNELDLSGEYPNLKMLNLPMMNQLKNITLPGLFSNLEYINLSISSIADFCISANNFPKLKYLNLSNTYKLEKMSLSGIFEKLITIDLMKSSIASLELSRSNCPNLQTQDPRIKFIETALRKRTCDDLKELEPKKSCLTNLHEENN